MSSCNRHTSSSRNGSNGTDGTGEEEEQEESSSNLTESTVEDALESFRKQWKQELHSSPKHLSKKTGAKQIMLSKHEDDCYLKTEDDIFNEATVLFKKGVENERAGQLYEAIRYYRKAVQLVPDIEFKLEEQSNKGKSQDQSDSEELDDISFTKKQGSGLVYENDEFANADFLLKIQRRLSKSSFMCMPEFDQKITHISALPMEIILYILRWVVSSELDMRSLEMCSRVCRGFYLCTRDSEIWRLACVRTWGINCGLISSGYKSWRQMFLERPRLLFNGCYISKTSYIRSGENSFQDQYYRPWHLVTYYRYIRFFPEGLVLMLTSADEPVQCLGILRNRYPKNPTVLAGRYILRDNVVSLVLYRQERNKNLQTAYKRNKRRDAHPDSEQTFHIELQLQNHQKRKSAQLTWLGYSVFTRNRNGTESNCVFDIVANRFPPLWYSRVKSYTAESECPLE